jgi:hypothetical protein
MRCDERAKHPIYQQENLLLLFGMLRPYQGRQMKGSGYGKPPYLALIS